MRLLQLSFEVCCLSHAVCITQPTRMHMSFQQQAAPRLMPGHGSQDGSGHPVLVKGEEYQRMMWPPVLQPGSCFLAGRAGNAAAAALRGHPEVRRSDRAPSPPLRKANFQVRNVSNSRSRKAAPRCIGGSFSPLCVRSRFCDAP